PATQDPVAIDFDGIQNRLWEVPVPADNYSRLYANGGRLFVQRSVRGAKSDLACVDIRDHDVVLKTIVDGIDNYRLTGDGKKLLVSKNKALYVIPAESAPGASLEKPVDLSGWTFALQPREEWKQ